MTYQTLSTKKRPVAFNMCLWSMKKTAIVSGIILALSLLCGPFYWLSSHGASPYINMADFNSSWLLSVAIVSVFCGINIIVTSCMNFRYMHSKTAGDMFHALPIKRTQLLLSNFLATVFNTIIILVINFGANLIIMGTMCKNFDIVPVLSTIAYAVGFIFIISAFCTLIAVCCGATFDMIVSVAAINIGWPILVFMINTICGWCLHGFIEFEYMPEISTLLSPFGAGIVQFYRYYESGFPFIFFCCWLIGGAIMLLAACMLSKRRKSETAGSSYSFAFLKYLVSGFVSASAGLVLAIIFNAVSVYTPDTEIGFSFYAFFIFGAVLAGIIVGAISNRGFKNIAKDLIVSAVSVGLVLIFLVSIQLGWFGFEKRVPDTENINSVSLSDSYSYYYGELERPVFTSKETIAAVTDLHKRLAGITASESNNYYQYDDYYKYYNNFNFFIEYKLGLGRTMSRQYQSSLDDCAKEYIALIKTDEYIEKGIPVFDKSRNVTITSIRFVDTSIEYYNEDGSYNENSYISLPVDETIKAYKNDLREITAENFKASEGNYYLDISYYTGGRRNMEYSTSVSVYKGFENILALAQMNSNS